MRTKRLADLQVARSEWQPVEYLVADVVDVRPSANPLNDQAELALFFRRLRGDV